MGNEHVNRARRQAQELQTSITSMEGTLLESIQYELEMGRLEEMRYANHIAAYRALLSDPAVEPESRDLRQARNLTIEGLSV